MDFAAHARSLGAEAETVEGIAALEKALDRAKRATRTSVIVIATDPKASTAEGGAWWDVPVWETPRGSAQRAARQGYERGRRHQKQGG